MMEKIIISIGWDVGGWQGDNNAFCICELEGDRISIKSPCVIKPKEKLFDNLNNIPSFLQDEINAHPDSKIILAVDSPLGFPVQFSELIINSDHRFSDLKKAYSNYAFRATDIYITEKVFESKTSLSPSFSYLTNNVTVAINMVRLLKSGLNKFKAYPFDVQEEGDLHSIIEVYPAATLIANKIRIEKYKGTSEDSKKRREEILDDLNRSNEYPFDIEQAKERGLTKIEHHFDAFICCLAAYDFLFKPRVEPEGDIAKKEGWIWAKKKL